MRGRQIATLALFTLLEAVRTRLPWLFALLLILIMGTGWFLHELAITESTRIQVGFSAAAIRLAAVFLLSLHVLTSVVREFNDKGLDLVLSFDLRRGDYILGRWLGFMFAALPIALLAALPQLLLAPTPALLQWTLSLTLELMMMTALSLFCIVTFTQLIPAAVFVFAFYLLARSLTAMQLMSHAPLAGGDAPSHQVITGLIDALALVLPALDHYTQSAWLVDAAAPWTALGTLTAQALLYTALLGAAAMFDFYRRNL